MQVETKQCMFCGKTGTVELTQNQIDRLAVGDLIQNALPDVTPEVREQLVTGTHPKCWNDNVPEDDEKFVDNGQNFIAADSMSECVLYGHDSGDNPRDEEGQARCIQCNEMVNADPDRG